VPKMPPDIMTREPVWSELCSACASFARFCWGRMIRK